MEYVELFNNSDSSINLYKWILKINDSRYTFTESVSLEPRSYLLVTKTGSCPLFDSSIRCTTVGNLTIPNEEALLVLETDAGETIHSVQYSAQMHRQPVKRKGGWSAELIDTARYCLLADNWASSGHPSGGTPGRANIAETPAPFDAFKILRAYAVDAFTCQLFYNQIPDIREIQMPENFQISGGSTALERANLLPPLYNSSLLHFARPIDSSRIYDINVKAGGYCHTGSQQPVMTRFALNRAADSADIVFNEIMFNAGPTGSEYIELYNRSAKTIDLSTLYLSRQNVNGSAGEPVRLCSWGRSIFPEDYIVITKDSSWLEDYYQVPSDRILRCADLFTLPNDNAHLLLYRYDGRIIDQLTYDEHWHLPLLAEQAGVALERVDDNSGNSAFNWTSAAAPIFATPGRANSQHSISGLVKATLQVSPSVVSPNNDGNNDQLLIRYEIANPGAFGTVQICDISGRVVRTVLNNGILGTRGILTWNGYNDKGQALRTGIYIVLVDLFTLDGKKSRIREPVTLVNGN